MISLLVGVIVAVGFLLLIVPGIIFLVFLSVAIPALIVENRRERMRSGGRGTSSRASSGTFAVVFVAAILVGIVSGIIGSIGGNEWVIRWIFTAIAQILTAPYAALVSIALRRFRARKEALNAATLRQELAGEPA